VISVPLVGAQFSDALSVPRLRWIIDVASVGWRRLLVGALYSRIAFLMLIVALLAIVLTWSLVYEKVWSFPWIVQSPRTFKVPLPNVY